MHWRLRKREGEGTREETVIKNRGTTRENDTERETERHTETHRERNWVCHVIGGKEGKCLVGLYMRCFYLFLLSVYSTVMPINGLTSKKNGRN